MSVFLWGVLVTCVVGAGILTGEWGLLFSRIQRGAAQADVVADVRRLVHNERSTQLFLIGAGLSLLGSVFAWFLVDHEAGLFVGLWVPSILSLGSLLTSHSK